MECHHVQKSIRKFRLICFATMLLVGLGCGTPLGPVFAELPTPSDEARVIIYRPRSIMASATDAILGIEQCNRPGGVVHLANGSFTRYDAVPGNVLIVGGVFSLSDREMINVKAGEEIYFRVQLGGFPLGIRKTKISRAKALPELRKLREAPVDPAKSSDDAC